MRTIFKNRLFIAALLLLLVELAGAFAISATALVYLRNQFSKSAMAKDIWPIISPRVISDIFINDLQGLVVIILSAMVIYVLYVLLKTFFLGGIYDIIVKTRQDEFAEIGALKTFLGRCAAFWPGFLKISLLGIVVYGIMLFLGFSFGQFLARFGITLRILILGFFVLLGSTYLQILRVRVVGDDNTSLRHAINATRSVIADLFVRIIVGNVSVAVVGLAAVFVFWLILTGIRHYNWNFWSALFSIILEQAIVLAICLMNVVRINYNCSLTNCGAVGRVPKSELSKNEKPDNDMPSDNGMKNY